MSQSERATSNNSPKCAFSETSTLSPTVAVLFHGVNMKLSFIYTLASTTCIFVFVSRHPNCGETVCHRVSHFQFLVSKEIEHIVVKV